MTLGSFIRSLAGPVAVGAFAALVVLEHRRPLRREVEPKIRRGGRNLAVAGLAAASMHLIERPTAHAAAALVERRNIGLLKIFRLPAWIELIAAVALLDYTLYLWHVLTHRSKFLWRFHIVHHADLDLDASTGCRFHFGELIVSVGWRTAQVLVLGVNRKSFDTWQAFLIPAVLFHHSNVRLPVQLERLLSKIVVTPRLHGIHHSVIREETDSNWSSGFSVWDRLHGTFRDISEHQGLTIGVPAYRESAQVTIKEMMALPFVEQPPTWLPPPTKIVRS